MGVLHDIAVESMFIRNGKLKHDFNILRKACQLFLHLLLHDTLALRLIRAVDINLRLQNGNQVRPCNPKAKFKLLVNDFLYSFRIGFFNHGTHLGSEYMAFLCPGKQILKTWYGLHEAHAVFLLCQPLIHFQDRYDSLYLPQIIRCKPVINLTFHGILKQYGCQYML